MNTSKAILASAVVTTTSTVVASIAPEKYNGIGELPDIKLVLGTLLAFGGLSTLEGFAPEPAAYISICMALTAFGGLLVPVLSAYFVAQPVKSTKSKSKDTK